MPIPLICRCQTRLQVKEHLAGTLVRCPKCGENLMVPRPAGAPDEEDSYELAPEVELPTKSPTCPSCNTDLAPGAVLCVNCGFHLVLKKHMGDGSGTR